jgi:SLOG in TRPM, prokaryote
MKRCLELNFSGGLTACAIRVHRPPELPVALTSLGLRRPQSVLVLVGGAKGLSEAEVARLRSLFAEALAPMAETFGAAVVDGGTDAGVMRLMGQAHHATNSTFPLLGVAATGTITLPNASSSPPHAVPLEPHHTHFVLVPGSEWGDESPWLAHVASVLAAGAPSVTVVINGGETTWEDVRRSVEASRPVVVISGSGRTADVLAAALRGEEADERAQGLSKSGLLEAVELAAPCDALWGTLEGLLSARS